MTFSLWSKNGDTIKGTHWGKEKRYYSLHLKLNGTNWFSKKKFYLFIVT